MEELQLQAQGERQDLQAATKPRFPYSSKPDLPSRPQLPTGIPAHTCRGALHSQRRPASSPPSYWPLCRIHRPLCKAHRSDVGWKKQEVATKALTNKVLSEVSNFPFHPPSSSLWRLEWNTQWPPL